MNKISIPPFNMVERAFETPITKRKEHNLSCVDKTHVLASQQIMIPTCLQIPYNLINDI